MSKNLASVLITNDAGIYLKYKGVFTSINLSFFGKNNNNETLAAKEKTLVDNGRGNKGAYECSKKNIQNCYFKVNSLLQIG